MPSGVGLGGAKHGKEAMFLGAVLRTFARIALTRHAAWQAALLESPNCSVDSEPGQPSAVRRWRERGAGHDGIVGGEAEFGDQNRTQIGVVADGTFLRAAVE